MEQIFDLKYEKINSYKNLGHYWLLLANRHQDVRMKNSMAVLVLKI
jgi:hypothetical protein